MPFDLPEAEIIAAPVQPEAAIAFWQWKAAMPFDAIRKLDAGAAERAFYVAGLSQRDAVQRIKEAMQAALESGETLAGFKARCADIIEREGWKDSRVETIFRNNMQSAYAAGRYAKMQEVKRFRPYWQYFIIEDGRARPSHAILNNLVFHADHEFWMSNYPPNGHRCRCGVRTLSERQVEREGLSVEKDMPGDGMYTDPKTGMEYHVARPGADDGWGTNPGKAWMDAGGSAPAGAAAGLPLERHPDLKPEAYAEQRLRPAPVKDYVELAKGIQEKAKPFLRNSTGVTGIALTRKNYFMATDSCGYFYISQKPYTHAKMGKFTPHMHLKDAWNKLASGKPMEWNEEYAVEALWHEIIHNRQKIARTGGQSSLHTRAMEIVTQWTARRTYPEFLKSLGAVPSHLESIKANGLGYGYYIKCFDRLLSVLKIDESKLLDKMHQIIDNTRRDSYLEELVSYIAKESGQTRKTIKTALDKTKVYGFEEELKKLGLINEP